MPTGERVLVLAPRSTETDRQLTGAAHRAGIRAERLAGWRVPADLHGTAAHVYAGPLFADAVAGELGIGLLEVPEAWLAAVPHAFIGRRIRAMPLAEARAATAAPMFVKPPNDKTFPARVYRDGTELPGDDLVSPETLVLVSEPVHFRSEFRLFCRDGQVLTASRYARDGDLAVAAAEECPEWPAAAAFAARLLAAESARLPGAVVLDIGHADGIGWAVVEANAAWASGGYACDPDAVLAVVLAAARPQCELPTRDLPFLRPAAAVER